MLWILEEEEGGDRDFIEDSEGSSSSNHHIDWNTDDEIEESSASDSSARHAKMIHHFMGMGFSRGTVIDAINENGGDNEEEIMETLLALTAEKPSSEENDEILSILVDMGFTFEEACTAIDKCGPKAEIGDLADFISASQLEDEIDSLQDLPKNKHVASVDTQTEVRRDYLHTCKKVKLQDNKGKYRMSWPKEKAASAVDMGMIVHHPGPMTGFGVHNEASKWWPSWDKRTKLNCLLTGIAPGTVTDRIRKTLEQFDDEPPQNVQENVLLQIKKWNLVWVGKNKLAPLEPDEYEMLLGFPKDHTRGGGVTRTERYRALGNAFQVDTVAYHLSVLKDRFPNGINVLSLFSGIGGAEVALHRLGIMLKNVVSVEIAEVNRNIIRCWWEQTNQKGNLIEVEDVQNVSSNQLSQWITKFGGFDLIIGGSPCNNFSGSNRVSRHGLEGEHSSLFYEYYRILEAVMEMQKNNPQ
ncbi:DNA (cytosine-5)-methyltransferase [Vigna angularis]|uniref:DNA (cytosine-5-)-methyltransferase n=1 Tax=Phaseolus angularis TaxID=3914 RepID=A0A8T0JKX4_PHAAN|nr:DNA (cytosine-5)-methyltransferase [Vigna angularis]